MSWIHLECLGISGNILENLEMCWNILETLEYLGSSTCSGEQYLPMLAEEFAKKAFHSGEKMFGGCKISKPGSNILLMHRHRKAEKMQRYTLSYSVIMCFHQICPPFMLPTSMKP